MRTMESLNSLVGYWNIRASMSTDQRYTGPYSTPRFNQRRHFIRNPAAIPNQNHKSNSETIKLFSKYRSSNQPLTDRNKKHFEVPLAKSDQQGLPQIATHTPIDDHTVGNAENRERHGVSSNQKNHVGNKRKKSVQHQQLHLPVIHTNQSRTNRAVNRRKKNNMSVARSGYLTTREDDSDWISDRELPYVRPEVVEEIDEEKEEILNLECDKENNNSVMADMKDAQETTLSGSSRRKSAPKKKQKLRHKRNTSTPLTPDTTTTLPLRIIPIAYFGQENGHLQIARWEDIDARSCDMRDPHTSVAYNNVQEYIQDNQLMTSRKAKIIWTWLRQVDKDLFSYDLNTNWFLLATDLNTS